jgi:hypothetical protein
MLEVSPMTRFATLLVAFVSLAAPVPVTRAVQDPHRPAIALQPLAQHVRRLESALAYIGQPLPASTHARLNEVLGLPDEAQAVARIQQILDEHVLIEVQINPESRVKVQQGAAAPLLVEGGTRAFLVKVVNEAGVTAPLRVSSPNSGRVSVPSWSSGLAAEPVMKLTSRDVAERWADISLFQKPPLAPRLSGSGLEYRILEVYSRDRGQRAAEISFDVGQGSQDIGFRNDVSVLFTAHPSEAVTIRVEDERGRPGVAALLVRDRQGRVYPQPSKRLAPDLPFQLHVYRADGESLRLPAGRYHVEYSGGPEYIGGELDVEVPAGRSSDMAVTLRRWIDPAARGWYSGDHHVHAAGCSHYENPTQGVDPGDMIRQVRGEGLNVGSVLTWGPCYYHQKQFFSSSRDHPSSTPDNLLHYDLEISGFPSSHAGHLVLLGLKEQDYPGATRIEHWPSWTLPILRWAKAQGAVTGFAHSGWGLEIASTDLPSDEVPAFDGIGANEFIVDVTHPDAIDFISAVDTPYNSELNIWYHTLNVGYRTRISGETDFPCITDERVGAGRTYARLDKLTYAGWTEAVRTGRTYVSDGKSHLMDFAVDGVAMGTGDGEVRLPRGGRTVRVTLNVAARVEPAPMSIQGRSLRDVPANEKPYWHLDRARVGASNQVPVEIVVNGRVAATRLMAADGVVRPLVFDLPIERSSWVAARILAASHTNPVFVLVDGKPIRSARSARWCLAAVDQCWTQKARGIREGEREEARRAYDHAREAYRRLLAESVDE